MASEPGLQLRVIKNNLDPVSPDHTTYGTHESYTCWAPASEAGTQLIPHLVSRVLYAGAGGLTGHSGGIGFELSQRARHLCTAVSDDTTCNRAIFSTRMRKETDGADGWTRIHLIGKDSQRAPFGIYLTFAVTGLLIEMINRGLPVGKRLSWRTWCKCAAGVFARSVVPTSSFAARWPKNDLWRSRPATWRSARRHCAKAVLPDWSEEAIQPLGRETLTAA